MRIGFGYDSHKTADGRDFILGGVKIPCEKGLLGHSDADVLTHAVIDALLGATADKDIGRHFPDTDEKYKDVSSLLLLSHVMKGLEHKISNIDCTVIAQKPKLAPYIDEIRESLAKCLKTDVKNVSVKAKTEEGADAVGRGELVKAYAAVLIE